MQEEIGSGVTPAVSGTAGNGAVRLTPISAAEVSHQGNTRPTSAAGISAVETGKNSNSSMEDKTSSTYRIRVLTNPALQDLLNFILSFGALISIILLVSFVVWDTFRHSITVEPISVPKGLSENRGFGPNVASRRLQDGIDKVLMHINRPPVSPQRSFSPSLSANRDADIFAIPGQQTDIIQESDLPSITLPAVGASLDSFATMIQDFL